MLAAALLFIACNCVHAPTYPDPDGADAREMMSQTVKVSVSIAGTKLAKKDGQVVSIEEVIGWTGSGVVVAVNPWRGNGESLVMSAAHVTNVPPIMVGLEEDGSPSIFIVKSAAEIVEREDGSSCGAIPIYVDVPNDVGVLRVDCVAGQVAELADRLPPVGGIVSVSGAGLGVHPKNVFLVTDGRFVGYEDGFNPQLIVTLPVAPGHSGSGVFFRGKIFGIVSRRTIRFEHMTLAVPLEHMRRAFDRSVESWNAD